MEMGRPISTKIPIRLLTGANVCHTMLTKKWCHSNFLAFWRSAMPKVMTGKDSGKPPTKSDSIRDVLDENPKAEAREIIDTLASRGIKVNASLVYLVRSKYRKRRRR